MGVYVVDKPLGVTSFDVVASARRAFRTRRVGHAGTLDPLATGVLVVATDESTKLVQFITSDSKDYIALVSFGATTATLDAEGPISATATATGLDLDRVDAALAALTGPQQQRPPAYSAIHVNGVRAYAAARAGEDVQLAPRDVIVHRLERLGMFDDARDAFDNGFAPSGDAWRIDASGRRFAFPEALGAFPTIAVFARVSSGTYLRSLARDLGERLGAPAHLAGLVRTRSGRFRLEDAVSVADLPGARPVAALEALDLPVVSVDALEARAVRDGKRLASSRHGLVAIAHDGHLVAVAHGDGSHLKVKRAWA